MDSKIVEAAGLFVIGLATGYLNFRAAEGSTKKEGYEEAGFALWLLGAGLAPAGLSAGLEGAAWMAGHEIGLNLPVILEEKRIRRKK